MRVRVEEIAVPLQAPDLDIRTFEQLVREARLRIPRYTPEWTDFNDSDPGMTLVQLFAWFTETLLYQMNRVPDRTYVKLLQLLNLELRQAEPSTAHLTFFPQAGAQVQSVLPGSQIAAQPPDGGDQLIFEVEAGLDLVRLPLAHVQVFDSTAFSVQSTANATSGQAFAPLGWAPQVNSALYLGFAQTTPPAVAPIFPPQLRLRVFRPLDVDAGRPQRADTAGRRPQPPVKLIWEYQYDEQSPQRWRRLDADDESIAFLREGYILLSGPQDIIASEIGRIPGKQYWLRCRLESGAYPAGAQPEIDMIRPNVVPARNLATVREEVLGISDGRPDQRYTLQRKPVLPGSLELVVAIPNQPGDARRWEQRPDFLASRPDALHYTLNANAGEIVFGDGIHGEIPVASAEIIARIYRYGGGSRGNVGADLVSQPLTSLLGVERATNERPAEGGRNEQSVDELLKEAPAFLRTRERAVTGEDYTALAARAGGVASAVAIPLMHPDHPGVEVPGAITVVIVPDNDDAPPVPSPDLIVSVGQFLNQRRLLTTEVYVKGPSYYQITVEAIVQARPYASFATVREAVNRRISEYLSPLKLRPIDPGDDPTVTAPGRQPGWAFGQELFPTNLYREILQVADVATARVALYVNGRPHDRLDQPVAIPPDGLVYGTNHTITVVPVRDL
jgi:predicted phage baseplate assembly protein